MSLIARAGEIAGLPIRTLQNWQTNRTNEILAHEAQVQQQAQAKFSADQALFNSSGIFETLDRVLAEPAFLRTLSQPVPKVMAVPPIRTPQKYSTEATYSTNPTFFAVVRWNRTDHVGNEMGSMFDDYYPVLTWQQLILTPNAETQQIQVEGITKFEPLTPRDWQNQEVLENALRWIREYPDFRGMTAMDFGIGHTLSPHYRGFQLSPRFIPGGYFDPSHLL